MSRRRSSTKNSNSDESENHNRQWVMITHESSLAVKPDEDSRPVLCRLRHPKTDSAAVYMFTDGCRKVLEIMAFNEGCRSWFIGNYVQSDGTLLVTTPIDPLFLALPYLVKASECGKFCPLDCLLDDTDFPECKRLTTCISMDELSNIAAVKGSDGLFAFKYDSDKTLLWLKLKVESLVTVLQQQKVNVSGSASVSTYVKSRKSAVDASQEDYVRYACGMISDYLQPDLAKQLREYLGVKPSAANDGSEKYSGHSPVKKKAKLESLTPLEDYSANGVLTASKKQEKLTTAQKALNKVDKKGMKSISAFFSASVKK